MRVLRYFPALFLLLWTAVEGQVPSPVSLTVDEAVASALQGNHALRIAWERAGIAEAKASEAKSLGLPSLRIQAGYTRLSDVGPFEVTLPFAPKPIEISPTVLDNYTSRISFQQPIFTGFRLTRASEAAESASEAARQDYEWDKTDAVLNVKTAYWNLYRSREARRVIGENIQQIEVHLQDARNLLAQGLLTEGDVLKVEVQLSAARLTLIDAENASSLAEMALNLQLGLPVETEVTLTSAPQLPSSDEEQQPDSKSVLTSRPDILAASLRVQSAEALAASARGGWFPQVSLVGTYYYSRPNPRILPTKDEFRSSWDAGLMFSFDLWNWGLTAHQTRQAEAVVGQAREACEFQRESARLELRQADLTLRQAKEKIRVAAQGVEQAEDHYRTMGHRFTAGTTTNTDLLDAETALLQARLSHTSALVELEIVRARRLKAQGRTD